MNLLSRLPLPLLIAAMTGACSPVSSDTNAQPPARQNMLKTVEAHTSADPAENCLLMA